MSYLALQISEHSRSPLPLITDELAAASTMVGAPERTTMSRRLRAVTRLLPVPPDARVHDIEAFWKRHSRELARFRDYLNELIVCDPADQGGEGDFSGRLKRAEEVRAHLMNEMRSFNWQEQGTAITMSALVTAAAPLDHTPWTLGAGLIGLGLLGRQALSAHGRRDRASKNRMVYSAMVAGRWPATTASTLW